MLIYSGMTVNKLPQLKERGMGICLSSIPSDAPRKQHGEVPCFLDNGAFTCWQKGYPFLESFFWRALDKAYGHSIALDFIVCPDLVAHPRSLEFSWEWAQGKLRSANNLALAVQDGMTPAAVKPFLSRFTHIFVGGTVDWKWQTAEEWVRLAHSEGLKCHIGRAGTLESLHRAYEIGADSVDSSSFVRNESWHIVDKFLAEIGDNKMAKQIDMWEAK